MKLPWSYNSSLTFDRQINQGVNSNLSIQVWVLWWQGSLKSCNKTKLFSIFLTRWNLSVAIFTYYPLTLPNLTCSCVFLSSEFNRAIEQMIFHITFLCPFSFPCPCSWFHSSVHCGALWNNSAVFKVLSRLSWVTCLFVTFLPAVMTPRQRLIYVADSVVTGSCHGNNAAKIVAADVHVFFYIGGNRLEDKQNESLWSSMGGDKTKCRHRWSRHATV